METQMQSKDVNKLKRKCKEVDNGVITHEKIRKRIDKVTQTGLQLNAKPQLQKVRVKYQDKLSKSGMMEIIDGQSNGDETEVWYRQDDFRKHFYLLQQCLKEKIEFFIIALTENKSSRLLFIDNYYFTNLGILQGFDKSKRNIKVNFEDWKRKVYHVNS